MNQIICKFRRTEELNNIRILRRILMKKENKTKQNTGETKKQGTIEIIKVSPLGLFFATVICASGSVCFVVLFTDLRAFV